MKRTHLQVVQVTRWLLRMGEPKPGITPARFDMLRIVELFGVHGAGQQRIQDLLGVSAPTVSRMLKSLEEIGLVFREPMEHDARMKRVFLTEMGLQRVRDARRELIDCGVAERMALRGLDFDKTEARAKLETLNGFLKTMRKTYLDRAAFQHPWTTDDLVPYLFPMFVDGEVRWLHPSEFPQYGATSSDPHSITVP